MRADWKLLMAFEAVARHGSFSRAATELNVQQPAMSRRVASLEAAVGVQLLHRTRPALSLTPEGEILHRAVSGSLVQVHAAMDQIVKHPDQNTLIVNTTIGFASCFLMRRMHAFREAYPDIMVELVSRDQSYGYQEKAADIIILFAHPSNLPGTSQKLIFGEEMIAVCAPGYQSVPSEGTKELVTHRLLHLTQGIHANDWDMFLGDEAGNQSAPNSSERFTSFIIYLQAVLNGDGIALGWENLLEDHLSAGTLVRASPHTFRSDRGYFCCLTTRAQENRAAQKFLDWIAGVVPSNDVGSVLEH